MTTPKIPTLQRSGARFYLDPDDGARKVPGVTSVVGMLPKDFLQYWAAKETATAAVDELGTLVSMAMRDRGAAIDHLKKAPSRNTRAAAETGTAAHDIFERMARGQDAGRIHPDLEPYARHFGEFLDVCQPTYHFLEETVWSEKHSYAGSFDAFATIEGARVFIDNKTTRSGVHAEVGLQLAAYRFADYLLRPDGEKLEMPAADGGAVLHVRPEGWKLVPVRCDEAVFEAFLHLRAVFDFEKTVKSGLVAKRPVASGPADTTPAPADHRKTAKETR